MHNFQLPIVLEPKNDESAMGYILRCAQTNGVNLHWLRRSIGMPDVGLFSRRQSRALAWLLQCSESWLMSGLPSEFKDENGVNIWWLNQKFTYKRYIKRQWPQLCPACVHLDGYCHQIWDLSLSTVCSIHQCKLIDECLTCHSRLRWDRPSIDICNCGYGFQPDSNMSAVDSDALELTNLLKNLISDVLSTRFVERDELPQFIQNMSINGVLMLMDILGRLTFNYQVVSTSRSTKSLRTHEWHEIAQRALSRLQILNDPKSQGALSAVLDEVVLKQMLKISTHAVDVQVAELLASCMLSGDRSIQRHLSKQLALFS
jgi:TniQ